MLNPVQAANYPTQSERPEFALVRTAAVIPGFDTRTRFRGGAGSKELKGGPLTELLELFPAETPTGESGLCHTGRRATARECPNQPQFRY